jgi:DNA mismatch repair protein MutS
VVDVVANIDFFTALATVAYKNHYIRPEIDTSDNFKITDGKHPVLANIIKDKFIANSCDFNESEKTWLLTGPNMAGKSTFLRQNALIIIMAQMGSYVPAKEASFGVVDQIFSRIGANDNIAQGESTFMVEMMETAYILNNATSKSFVIFDEVGRGTSTHDGMAIAWAVLNHLYNTIKCRTLFATHYHELTAMAAELEHVVNQTMAVKEWENNIIFLHKITPGIAGRSYGIHVAKIAGLPERVINHAQEVLDQLCKNNVPDIAPVKTSISENKLVNIIKNVNIDETTPIDALKILQELTNELKNNEFSINKTKKNQAK